MALSDQKCAISFSKRKMRSHFANTLIINTILINTILINTISSQISSTPESTKTNSSLENKTTIAPEIKEPPFIKPADLPLPSPDYLNLFSQKLLYSDIPIGKLADLFEKHAFDNKILEHTKILQESEYAAHRRTVAKKLKYDLENLIKSRQRALKKLVEKTQKVFKRHKALVKNVTDASRIYENGFGQEKKVEIEELNRVASGMFYCDGRNLNNENDAGYMKEHCDDHHHIHQSEEDQKRWGCKYEKHMDHDAVHSDEDEAGENGGNGEITKNKSENSTNEETDEIPIDSTSNEPKSIATVNSEITIPKMLKLKSDTSERVIRKINIEKIDTEIDSEKNDSALNCDACPTCEHCSLAHKKRQKRGAFHMDYHNRVTACFECCPNLNCNFKFDEEVCDTNTKINSTRSAAVTPIPIYTSEPYMRAIGKITNELTDTFVENSKDEHLKNEFQYFVHTSGLTRYFPATKWTSSPTGNNVFTSRKKTSFDSRLQSWYRNAITIRKDILILLDISGSMGGRRIAIAREAIKMLMDTLTKEDNINVIVFSNDYRILEPCFKSGTTQDNSTARTAAEGMIDHESGHQKVKELEELILVPATQTNKNALIRRLKDIQPLGKANFKVINIVRTMFQKVVREQYKRNSYFVNFNKDGSNFGSYTDQCKLANNEHVIKPSPCRGISSMLVLTDGFMEDDTQVDDDSILSCWKETIGSSQSQNAKRNSKSKKYKNLKPDKKQDKLKVENKPDCGTTSLFTWMIGGDGELSESEKIKTNTLACRLSGTVLNFDRVDTDLLMK